MISIEPFSATREVWRQTTDGGLAAKDQPCKVLGITKNEDGVPVYIIEVVEAGESYLTTEETIHRLSH